jgi:hypothetical protein
MASSIFTTIFAGIRRAMKIEISIIGLFGARDEITPLKGSKPSMKN